MCQHSELAHFSIQGAEVLHQATKQEDHHEATGQQKIAPSHGLVLEDRQVQGQGGAFVLFDFCRKLGKKKRKNMKNYGVFGEGG